MTKDRAAELLLLFPHWSKEELQPTERAELWHQYRKLISGYNPQMSFKTVLEWIINGEL